MNWLIWSHEHQAYWRANCCGYTTDKKEAGAYTFDEAVKIVFDANKHLPINSFPNEAMLPVVETILQKYL